MSKEHKVWRFTEKEWDRGVEMQRPCHIRFLWLWGFVDTIHVWITRFKKHRGETVEKKQAGKRQRGRDFMSMTRLSPHNSKKEMFQIAGRSSYYIIASLFIFLLHYCISQGAMLFSDRLPAHLISCAKQNHLIYFTTKMCKHLSVN